MGDLFSLLSGFKRLCYSLCVFWLDLANTIGSLVSPKNCACGMAIFRPIVFYGVRIALVAKQLRDAPLIAPPIVDWYAGVKDGEVRRMFTYASH